MQVTQDLAVTEIRARVKSFKAVILDRLAHGLSQKREFEPIELIVVDTFAVSCKEGPTEDFTRNLEIIQRVTAAYPGLNATLKEVC